VEYDPAEGGEAGKPSSQAGPLPGEVDVATKSNCHTRSIGPSPAVW
jgi:hypothetical protein